ncbi:MAG: CehA/McbA family metallohydrolase, partial [Anaerolineae bacterium]
AGHRPGNHHVVIGTQQASPGFLPGPLPVGEWIVQVDAHMVMPGQPCHIQLDVSASDEQPQGRIAPPLPGHTASRGPGWYRGDVHAHSIHSDAPWDIPDLVAWARSRHLDFCTLTDHSTVSGLPQMLSLSADDLLTMGGMELTTFHGHALALGVREWMDWRLDSNRRTMEQIAQEVEARGGLFIMAHPMETGDPYCTGCQWEYAEMRPGEAHVVEVWNHGWEGESNNEEGLQLAYQWLNDGCRLALTSGNDNHGRNPDAKHFAFDVVYAEDLSEREILRAIRAGHLYVSAGPRFEFTASAGNDSGMMGDTLNVAAGAPVQLSAAWRDGPENAELCLIADGVARESLSVGPAGEHRWELQGGEANWCLLTLRAPNGLMLALTNPIFLDWR